MNEADKSSTINGSDNSLAMDHHCYQESAAIWSARLILEVTIAFFGLLGNLLVCIVISRQRKFRSGLKLFIQNLALADIGILIVLFPIAVVQRQMPSNWPFGRIFCLYFYPLTEVFHGVSIWSVTAIAIERYRKIATNTGVHASAQISTKPLKWGLLLIWVVSFLVVSVPLFFDVDFVDDNTGVFCAVVWSSTKHKIYFVCMCVFWYILPLGIIVFTYVQISRQLQQSDKFHRSSISRRSRGERKLENSVIRSSEERKRMRQNSKAKKVLTPIVIVFAVSMFPVNGVRVLQVFWEDITLLEYFGVIYDICVIGVLINSASDPVIYSMVSKDFRVELKALWFGFAQRLRNLIKIKKTDGNANIRSLGVCYRIPQEGQFSAEQEGSVLETPQLTMLASPVLFDHVNTSS